MSRSFPASSVIPVFDLGELVGTPAKESSKSSFLTELGSGDDDTFSAAASELCNAWRSVGFVYLKNHGIPERIITDAFLRSREFFSLPAEDKAIIPRSADVIQGFSAVGSEILDVTGRRIEVRESFDMIHFDSDDEFCWPEPAAADDGSSRHHQQQRPTSSFRLAMTSLRLELHKLALLLLRLISVGLGHPETMLVQMHSAMGTAGSGTCLRTLFYPPLDYASPKRGDSDAADMAADKTSHERCQPLAGRRINDQEIIRCGEHSDYGSITLLLQDDMGGLEVLSREDRWIPADPIPGTILVNIGDLMEIWTNGDLRATKHRVIVPDEEEVRSKARQSIVLFVHPNDDVIVEPLSSVRTPAKDQKLQEGRRGSGSSDANGVEPMEEKRYAPVQAGEFLKEKLRATYI